MSLGYSFEYILNFIYFFSLELMKHKVGRFRFFSFIFGIHVEDNTLIILSV